MANDAAKKMLAQNKAIMSRYNLILPGVNLVYIAYRMYYLWDSFSGWHIAAFVITSIVYLVCYMLIARAAAPKYAPLEKGGGLVSGGADLSQAGVLEYSWDMLYTTMFVQLSSAFISDWFWLLYLIPPCIGFYFLWTMVIYPWISRPDSEPEAPDTQGKKAKVKYGKAR